MANISCYVAQWRLNRRRWAGTIHKPLTMHMTFNIFVRLARSPKLYVLQKQVHKPKVGQATCDALASTNRRERVSTYLSKRH